MTGILLIFAKQKVFKLHFLLKHLLIGPGCTNSCTLKPTMCATDSENKSKESVAPFWMKWNLYSLQQTTLRRAGDVVLLFPLAARQKSRYAVCQEVLFANSGRIMLRRPGRLPVPVTPLSPHSVPTLFPLCPHNHKVRFLIHAFPPSFTPSFSTYIKFIIAFWSNQRRKMSLNKSAYWAGGRQIQPICV